MQRQSTSTPGVAPFNGERYHRVALPRIEAIYAWRPPFKGAWKMTPNKVSVVFSHHHRAVVEQSGVIRNVDVEPGGLFVVGSETTATVLEVPNFSDTLEVYPDIVFLQTIADEFGISDFTLRSTFGQKQCHRIAGIGAIVPVAQVLRQACLGMRTLSAIEESSLEHLLAACIVGGATLPRGGGRLAPVSLQRVIDRVEDELDRPLTLDQLADEANLSTFHFARSFKRSTGLSPHKYVQARRIERAKHQLMTTDRSVEEIATSLGFENLHHFPRQFQTQLAVLPSVLRSATRGSHEQK